MALQTSMRFFIFIFIVIATHLPVFALNVSVGITAHFLIIKYR